MIRYEVTDLPHYLRVSAQREIDVDTVLQDGKPFLLEALDMRACERLVREISEWRSSPKIESLAQQACRELHLAPRERGSALGRKARESMEIQSLGLDLQDIPVVVPRDLRPITENLAEIRHKDLERPPRAATGVFAPYLIEKQIGRDNVVRIERQHRQNRALLRAGQGGRPPIDDDLQPSQKSNLDGPHPLASYDGRHVSARAKQRIRTTAAQYPPLGFERSLTMPTMVERVVSLRAPSK
jgi:hypothetical protein